MSSLSSSSSSSLASSTEDASELSSYSISTLQRLKPLTAMACESEHERLESPRIMLPTQTTFRSTILMDDLVDEDDNIGGNSLAAQIPYPNMHNKELTLSSTYYQISTVNSKPKVGFVELNTKVSLPTLTILTPSANASIDATRIEAAKEHSPMFLDECPPMLDSLFSFYSLSSPSQVFVTITDFCNSSFGEFDVAIEKDRSHGRLRGTITERSSMFQFPTSVASNLPLDAQTTAFESELIRTESASKLSKLPMGFLMATCSFEISLFNAPSTSCPHRIACEVQYRSGERDLFSQFFNLLTNHLSDCIIDRADIPQFLSLSPPTLPNLSNQLSPTSSPYNNSLSSLDPPIYDSEIDLDLFVFNHFHPNAAVNV